MSRNFVRRHCWLINLTGKRDGHTPIDRGMEAAIKDIKVHLLANYVTIAILTL